MDMIWEDKIYGSAEIKENVIIDLMNTAAMKRLKEINQYGHIIFLNSSSPWSKMNVTRFEHSVGVYLLLKKLNASLEEQVAGLLHDISHTAFSHVTDFLFNRHTQQDYHGEIWAKKILNSEIPKILKRYDINVDDILNIEEFTLLKRKLPDVYADLVDYFLRDSLTYGSIDERLVNSVLNSIANYDGKIVFTDRTTPKLFAEKFIEINKLFWCNPLQVVLFHLASEAIKLGISTGVINEEELFTIDEMVYNKLKNSNVKEITQILNQIQNVKIVEDRNNYDMNLKSKIRYVDPEILIDNKTVRLSEIDSSYKKMMENFVNERKDGFFIKIV